ncbi:DUF4307 domain-containing protein [Curtobacterium sp. MCLR17_007]|uniref:DUF4307 domain-containing protein n=1 Tax=Curtobacterium sp. MCLR17_007 TaxID=2175648 RepID=UPI0024DFE822|nr:DUF4307 domain-containing protein [Curtobacterium sp. MCLR17_007]WIB61057.1 DUF4307 domain-containing protein [Curtobacterium sp. MCLR17_007]
MDTQARELPWDQDIHPGSPQLSEHTPTPSATTTLDDRYGRTPGRSRRTRLVAILVAAAIVVVFGAWVIWAGPGQTSHGIDSDDVGYKIVSEHRATVDSQVSVDPGQTMKCAVQVLDKSYTIVGWKVVTLPPATERTRSITTTVNTTTRGVTGLIHTCWVP